MDKPAEIRIIKGEHRVPAVLPKCRCGGEPERMSFCSMNPYYTIVCKKCGVKVSEEYADETYKKWVEQSLPKCGCGGDPKIGHYNIHVTEFYHVYCDKCGRETKAHSSESEAIKDWCKWPDLPFGKRKAEVIINA